MQEIQLPVYIPARNEGTKSKPKAGDGIKFVKESNLEQTVNSLKKSAEMANVKLKTIVVNDGSTDNTSELANELVDFVIDLPNRGYSALGKPELSETHNEALQFIKLTYDAPFVMVVGADTILDENYIKAILDEFKTNRNLMICGGLSDVGNPAPNAVRGAGRIYRRQILDAIGWKLPYFHAWESYPIYYAQANGYETYTIHTVSFGQLRPSLSKVNWKNYGIGMYELGAILPYVFGRAAKHTLHGHFKRGSGLIYGYFIGVLRHKPRYPKHVRKYVQKYQWKRIVYYISFGKINLL